MKRILDLILLFGLWVSCTRTTDKPAVIASLDSVSLLTPGSSSFDTLSRSLYTDSLLTGKGEIDTLFFTFITSGRQVSRYGYGGGDCNGAYQVFNRKGDNSILTIDKYDCGDYGFGNSQYLTKNDSILLAREFKVEWYKSTLYTVTEKIIKFDNGNTILKEREMNTTLGNLRFGDKQFKESKASSDEEYFRIKKELIEKGKGEN